MANIDIGGRLHSTATGNVVTGANEVLDDSKGKKQSVINAEVDAALEGKQDEIADLTAIRSGAAAGATAYQKPGTGIPSTDMTSGVQTSLGKADSAYQKPSGGIPKTDLESGVQESLELADSAVQADPIGSIVPPVDPSEFATKEEIEGLEAKVDGVPNTDITSLPALDGHMGADGTVNTTSGFKHLLFPVTQYRGDYISVVFNNPSWGGQYAFISAVNGNTYTFVSGGSRLSGYPTNEVVPSDANYLYQLVSGNDGVVIPGYIKIELANGSLKEQIAEKENSSNKVTSWGGTLSDTKYPSEKLVKVSLDEKLESSQVLDYVSKNLINPTNASLDRRYSIGNVKIQAESSLLIASSGLIPVIEGEWYVISGTGFPDISNPQGGYFGATATGAIGEQAIANIVFTSPVDNVGKCFEVPLGQGIKYVVLNLKTNDGRTALFGDAQMEKGEQATEYSPYNPQPKIKDSLLPSNSSPGEDEESELKKYTTFGNLIYPGIGAKIPSFRQHFYAKDKDLVVVNTGTSLTARSSEHCTLLTDAAFRPPLMHSNNFASHIWDKLCWQGQQYRRYDSGFFTEAGTGWQTQSNIADWDDGAYRAGLTRYTDNGGSIAFAIPSGAWQFNFIYRSDSQGSTDCVIAISEGNNKVEVWNGSAWVEANGYVFSERESPVTILPSITFQSPNTGQDTTITDFQVKGNTTYQKRLKMRCKSGNIDSRENAKSVTITSASGRLLYWGVEWSELEYMITYINAARGSHGPLISDGANGLVHYQDNEIWSFNPDLLLSEDPIHNGGGGGVPQNTFRQAYFGNVTENFWFANNGVSMKSRCATLGLTEPEWALFNTTITWNFGGINDDGTLKYGPIYNGLVWSALESQSSVYMAMLTNHPEIIYINAVKNWVDAGMTCYHSMKAATVGSGKDGATFTNEGSHWNDTGCKIMARVILPILDFVI